MKDSKITTILRIFSKEEIKSFGKFIISPYFASRRDIFGYYTLLKSYYPDFNINRIEFFKKLFPNEEFNEKKLKNLSSEMVKLAEKFLVHQSIESNETEFKKTLTREYIKRNSERMFWKTLNNIEFKKDKAFNSVECFNEEEEIEWLKVDYYSEKNEFDKSLALRVKHTDYLITSFLIRFFRRLNDRMSADSYNFTFESPLINAVLNGIDFDKVIKETENENSELSRLIKIYYYAYKANSSIEDESYYYTFKNLFYAEMERFSNDEKFLLFDDLLSCCWNNRAIGNEKFAKEQFEVYKDTLNYNAYLSDLGTYMNVVFYRNIMFIALIRKEYKWLEEFIEKYTGKLRPEFIENMKNLALAHLYFEQSFFEEALKYSARVQYDFFAYKLDIKHLLLKIYYELGLYEEAYSLLDTYRHFLRESNEVSDHHKKWHDGFTHIYTKLLKIKSSKEYKDAEMIEHEMSNTKNIMAAVWLREKIEELSKKGS